MCSPDQLLAKTSVTEEMYMCVDVTLNDQVPTTEVLSVWVEFNATYWSRAGNVDAPTHNVNYWNQ